jgi:capsular polysaccharide biosynthesis protein
MVKVFQKQRYDAFTPRCEALTKPRIVSRSGVVFDPKLIWRTVYRNPIVAVMTIAISLLSLARRGVSPVEPQTQFGFIHSIWTAGYYHWLTESLPRALVMRRDFPDAVPLMPEGNYRNFAASLNCLGFERVAFFADSKNVLVRAPIVTECARAFGTTDPKLLREIRQRVTEYLGPAPRPAASKIVYVSRAKARGRRVLNEAEIVEVMQSFGAEIVCFEDFDFFEQAQIMSQTRLLVSIHGAGLTNMMFMPEGGKVVEIIPRKNGIFEYNYVRNSFRHDACYVRLAGAMGHDYTYLLARPEIKFYQKTHMANIWVDADRLRTLLVSLT